MWECEIASIPLSDVGVRSHISNPLLSLVSGEVGKEGCGRLRSHLSLYLMLRCDLR